MLPHLLWADLTQLAGFILYHPWLLAKDEWPGLRLWRALFAVPCLGEARGRGLCLGELGHSRQLCPLSLRWPSTTAGFLLGGRILVPCQAHLSGGRPKRCWAPSFHPGSERFPKAGKEEGPHGWAGVTLLTVWRELVPLEHGDAEDLLLQVSDEELAVGIPLGIQGVLDRLGDVALGAHGHLAVRVTLPYSEQSLLDGRLAAASSGRGVEGSGPQRAALPSTPMFIPLQGPLRKRTKWGIQAQAPKIQHRT